MENNIQQTRRIINKSKVLTDKQWKINKDLDSWVLVDGELVVDNNITIRNPCQKNAPNRKEGM